MWGSRCFLCFPPAFLQERVSVGLSPPTLALHLSEWLWWVGTHHRPRGPGEDRSRGRQVRPGTVQNKLLCQGVYFPGWATSGIKGGLGAFGNSEFCLICVCLMSLFYVSGAPSPCVSPKPARSNLCHYNSGPHAVMPQVWPSATSAPLLER